MAAPAPQQTTTDHHGESALTTTAPPAYSEKEAPGEGQAPAGIQQPSQPGAQGQYLHDGALPQTWPQGYLAPPVGGPGYQFPMVAVAPQQPPYDAPHDFLFLAMVTTIICGILNLISLSLGIPAIILSVMSLNAKGNKDYPQAKNYGKYSLVMTVLNVLFTLCVGVLVTGLVLGCSPYLYADNYGSYC